MSSIPSVTSSKRSFVTDDSSSKRRKTCAQDDTWQRTRSSKSTAPESAPKPEQASTAPKTTAHVSELRDSFTIKCGEKTYNVALPSALPECVDADKVGDWLSQIVQNLQTDVPGFTSARLCTNGEYTCDGKPWMPSQSAHVKRLLKWLSAAFDALPWSFEVTRDKR